MPSWSQLLPGRPEQVERARLFTRMVLTGRDQEEAAALVVSELASNALRHTASGAPGGTFTVSVMVHGDGVLVGVDDLGPAGEWRSATPRAMTSWRCRGVACC